MQSPLDLSTLARRVQQQAEQRNDYLVPQKSLALYHDDQGGFGLEFPGHQIPIVTRTCQHQLAEAVSMPGKFWDHLATNHAPVLADTVTALCERAEAATRMVRTVGSTARACLSDRYEAIDNDLVLPLTVQILEEMQHKLPDVRSADCDLDRMVLKVTFKTHVTEWKRGAPLAMGFRLRNSEVGDGALALDPLIEELVCTNGMVATRLLGNDAAFRKVHAGARQGQSGSYGVTKYATNRTRELAAKTMVSGIRDLIEAIADGRMLDDVVAAFRRAANDPIPVDKLTEVVKMAGSRFGFSSAEGESILDRLARSGEINRYGLHAAVTNLANDVASYDRACQLEEIGGKIISLDRSEWSLVAEAA